MQPIARPAKSAACEPSGGYVGSRHPLGLSGALRALL